MDQQITTTAKLLRCTHCQVWWGTAGDDETTLEMLMEATDDPDDLKWDAYRGWHTPGPEAMRCPECGRPGEPVKVVFD